MEQLTHSCSLLEARLFSVERFANSDKDLNFYTGFPNKGVFDNVFDFLDPGNEVKNIRYWHSSSDKSEANSLCDDEDAPK